MDSRSACKIDVRATMHLKVHTTNFQLVVDRDTLNLKDLTDDVADKVTHGPNQGMHLSFLNKNTKCSSRITKLGLATTRTCVADKQPNSGIYLVFTCPIGLLSTHLFITFIFILVSSCSVLCLLV